MVKEIKKNEGIKRRPLSERALSTALAGMLAMSVCGSTMIAFATDDEDSLSGGLQTEKAVTELIENDFDPYATADELGGGGFSV